MKKFSVGISFKAYEIVTIEAETAQEAFEQAYNMSPSSDLMFKIDDVNIEDIKE